MQQKDFAEKDLEYFCQNFRRKNLICEWRRRDQCNTWESWSSVKGFFFPALLDAFLHTAAILGLGLVVMMVMIMMTWNRTRIIMKMSWRIMSDDIGASNRGDSDDVENMYGDGEDLVDGDGYG